MKFNIFDLKNSAILYLYAQKDRIETDPIYQRNGEVWTRDKQQLLIDTIINGFDVPKIYFHDLKDFNAKSKFDFAIVDGKQRLGAIWDFIDGEFPLASDFSYLSDSSVKIAGLKYSELSQKYPSIKQFFDANSLSVVVVQTDDIDLIEDMFSRLNEAVPLNAAEKRNAFGGPLPKVCRDLAAHSFFTKNLKISNKRYQHRDLAAKMLYLSYEKKIVDTKKVYLDTFFKKHKARKEVFFSKSSAQSRSILTAMQKVFGTSDALLRSAGMVVLYYLLFSEAVSEGWSKMPSRAKLVEFELARTKNRETATKDIAAANYDYLEFDRLNQTPNDAYALKWRLEILRKFVGVKKNTIKAKPKTKKAAKKK